MEGAEDFDVYKHEYVETVQVKDTKKSGPVSLRSDSILKSISNFWHLKEKNPGIMIRFRFLTTADRCHEKSSPFGDIRGLDYWDLCRNIQTDLNPLRDFLKSQNKLPVSLLQFVEEENDSEFRNKLIIPIEWDTGNEQKEYIEELVIREVCYYGHKYAIPPSESSKVVPHLFAYIEKIICKPDDRKLDYHDFMIIFEEVTSERIPRYELDLLRRSQLFSSQFAFLSSQQIQFRLTASLPGGISAETLSFRPILPDRLARRQELVNNLSRQLDNNHVVILKGSTGTGKSIMASLIIELDTQNWTWLSIRGLEPAQIKELFFKIALIKTSPLEFPKYIIDDLNFEHQPGIYENALAALFYSTFSSGGYIIITTQGDVPDRIKSAFNLNEDSFIEVPYWNESEIKNFLILYDCPENIQNAWVLIILGKTRGHPQLVHAWSRRLHAMNWPLPFHTDISEEDDIELVRRNARKTLTEQLPSAEARLLAYRLSILGQPFRRVHAIEIGTLPPKISFPGEAFDLLIGPWIERLSNNYFQISPLLEDAAKDILTQDEIIGIHAKAAESFIKYEPRTILEAKGAIFHGLAGNAESPVIHTLVSLLKDSNEEDIWSIIFSYFIWLVPVKIKPGEKLFPNNIYISVMLRLFQFKIASTFENKIFPPLISHAWENEIDSIIEPKTKRYMRALFLIQTIIRYEVYFPPKIIISRIIEFRELIKNDPVLTSFSQDYSTVSGSSLTESLIQFAIQRCKDADDVNEFFNAIIDYSRNSNDNEILILLQRNHTLINTLFNKIWLKEAEKESPDWIYYITLFNNFVAMGFSWGVESIAIEAYRVIAIIQDEYLNNAGDALLTLEDCRNRLNRQDPILEDEHATILFHQGKYKEALSIWENILPNISPALCEVLLFSFRKAQICAGKLGDWDKAENLALLGSIAANVYDLPDKPSLTRIGYLADYAFALWKNGHLSRSINIFAEVLSSFDRMPDPDQNLKSYTIQKLVGHGIAWINQNISNDMGLAEPSAGCFSNPNINEEIKQYRLYPDIFLWSLLSAVEYETKSGNSILKQFEERSKHYNFPVIRYHLTDLKIRNSLQTTVLDLLVDDFKEFISYDYYCKKYCRSEDEVFKEIDSDIEFDWNENVSHNTNYLQNILFAGLIIMVSRNNFSLSTIDLWAKSISKYGFWNGELEKWFSLAKQGFEENLSDLVKIMKDSQSKLRGLASLFILAWDRGDPEDLCYANYILLAYATENKWRKEIEGDIETMTTKTWAKVVSDQPFSILYPTMNIPNIMIECESSILGLKKAARILLAAKNAIKRHVPQEIINQLKLLAGV